MNESSAVGDIAYVYDKAAIARSVARMLLEIDAVLFRADEPFNEKLFRFRGCVRQ